MEKVSQIIYFISFLLYFVKSSILFQYLELPNEDTSIEKLTGDKYYKVIPLSQSNLQNYLKITVKEYDSPNSYYGKHVISYYQNVQDFKDRKELSQNNTDTVVMWLNKEQYQKEFYLSIEFEKPCEYYISITYNEYIELYPGEKYTYYVKEENKEMNFFFKLDFIFKANLTIFAGGGKEINSTLSGIDSIKHSKYNSYLIELKSEINDYDVYFNVEGKVGDLINVALFIQKYR